MSQRWGAALGLQGIYALLLHTTGVSMPQAGKEEVKEEERDRVLERGWHG